MTHRHFGNILLLVLSLTLSILIAEVVFRLVDQRSMAASDALEGETIDLQRLNFNDTVVYKRKPADEFRILGFGDSFAYSIMAPPLSYSGLVARNLNATIKGKRFRFVNLGEPASTVRDYAAAYTFWADKVDHDAVLFNIYLGNDILDVAYHYVPEEWQLNRAFKNLDYHMADGSKRSAVPQKYPLRLLDYAVAVYLTAFGMDNHPPSKKPADERFNLAANHNLTEKNHLETNKIQMVNFDFSRIGELISGYREVASFLQFVSEVRKKGVKVVVSLAPNEAHADLVFRRKIAETFDLDLSTYDITLPARLISQIRNRIDPHIEMIDLSPHFVCRSDQGEDLYYLTNTHWGPEGNALAAEAIAGYLGSAWFNEPPAPSSGDCDEERYHARFFKVPEAAIANFVTRLLGNSEMIADFDPAKVLPDLTSGGLDGAVFDEEKNNVFLWGWAFDPRNGQPAIGVLLFDNQRALAELIPLTRQRPDVAEFYDNPRLMDSGWNYYWPVTDLGSGDHAFTAFAVFADGRFGRIPVIEKTSVTID